MSSRDQKPTGTAPPVDSLSGAPQQSCSETAGYRQIADEAHDAILITLADGSHVYANQKAEEITGYSKEELVRIRMQDLAHPDEIPILRERLKKRLKGEPIPKTYPTRICHKDGHTVHIELTGLKTIFEGRPADVVIFSDRTEVVEKTKALDRSNAHLRTLIDNTDDLICAIDMDGRIQYANTSFQRLFAKTYGHRVQDGDDLWSLFPDKRRKFWKAATDRVLDEGIYRFDQHYIIDGRRHDIDWSCGRVLDNDRRPIGVTVFGRDITQRLTAQEALQESQASLFQARKIEALSTLCGGLAHEFNNFLGAILGNVEMTAVDSGDSEKVCEYAADAKAAALKAKSLVGKLLRLTNESFACQTDVDFDSLIRKSLSLLSNSMPSYIQIKMICSACPSVRIEPEMIRQVVHALITNAVEAIVPNAGTITVCLAMANPDATKTPCLVTDGKGSHLVLKVTDTGAGIDSAVMDRIFEPFFTTKERPDHSGLGLAVAQGIVASHNGMIQAENEIGGGTTFSVYLPVTQSLADASVAAD